MPVEAYVGLSCALLSLVAALASKLASIARVQAVEESGISLRTLVGVKKLAWSEVRSPVQLRPRSLLAHIVVRLKHPPFLSLRSAYMVHGRLESAQSLAAEISRYIKVEESRVF